MKSRLWLAIVLCLVLVTLPVLAYAFDWSVATPIGTGGDWDQDPSAAAGTNGNLFVAWTTYPYSRNVYFVESDGSDWSTPVRLNGNVQNSFRADVAVGPDGEPHVLWNGVRSGYSTFYVRRQAGVWSSPEDVGLPFAQNSMAVARDGKVFAATGGGSLAAYAIRTDAGWTNRGQFPSRCAPDVSIDAHDTAYLVYCTADGVVYRTWTGDGWSEPSLISSQVSYQITPRPKLFHASDGTMDLVMLDGHELYHYHFDGSSWEAPRILPAAGGRWTGAAGRPDGVVAAVYFDAEQMQEIWVRVWDGHRWTTAEDASNTRWHSIMGTVGLTTQNKIVAVWAENPLNQFPWVLYASQAKLNLNHPPVCSAAEPSQASLWPADHKLQAVEIQGVTDPDGDPVTITVDSVFQDELVNSTADGDTAPDAVGVGTSSVSLRDERDGSGDGRFYHVAFTADDGRGGTCQGEVQVVVPQSSAKDVTPVDGGALFDSTTQ